MITTLLQGERWIQPVPLGRFQATQMSLSRQHPFIPHRFCLSGSRRVFCRSVGTILSHWSCFIGAGQGCCSQTQLREPIPDPCPALDPPRPQHTLPLAGEALPPFQADNRPFPGKSLHAAVQTDPQSTAADAGAEGPDTQTGSILCKGETRAVCPRGGHTHLTDPSTPLRRPLV